MWKSIRLDETSIDMTNCSNCKSPITDNFCSHCGQAAKLKRIDGKYILHEIVHVLHLEKGILFTIKELIVRPGKSVRTFISEDRSRLVKPVIFIIVTSLIYTIASHWFVHVEENHSPLEKSILASIAVIFEWIQHHYGYANMIMGVFIALWLKLFFRKHDSNFFEILILLCFVMGIGMLLLAVSSVIEGVSGIHLARITEILGVIYCSWAIGQFFDKSKISSYLKAFGAYLLGMISYYILIMILCIVVIMIKN
ncbi:DUF3667 domain-containing protein [Fluviicola taffensis]|uniref:DUF3667 domain-containing protein n=1 Tax=Fluviicola taffensis TaxID=191579 RepID=UPI003137F371